MFIEPVDIKRANELLEAAMKLLAKQEDSMYVLNLLEETVFYDETDCDGSCLLEDIRHYFGITE